MISTVPHELPVSVDPWIVPDPGDHVRFGDVMPLSPVESAYQAIQSATPTTSSLRSCLLILSVLFFQLTR
jgi:hypothetical protein